MTAKLDHGWIVVDYSGADLARVHIAVGAQPIAWKPAFLDWHDGQRVAKTRPPVAAGRGRSVPVWVRVDGHTRRAGAVTL